jgi:cobalt-zinc-cadmium efflux system outer membrane protein
LEFELGRGETFSNPNERRFLRGFLIRQTFENPFSRKHRMGARQAEVDAAAEGVREVILVVEYQIREHFNRILFLQKLVGLNALNEEALSEVRALIETRAELGEVRELEAIRLRVEHIRAQNELEATEIELDQFRKHLNTFLGNRLPPDYELKGTLAADPSEPELEFLTQEILPNHPALAKVAKEKEAVQLDLKKNEISWFPDPSFSFSSSKELDGNARRFGFGLAIPLWNQGGDASQKDREKLRMLGYQAEFLRLELEAQLMIHHNHLRKARQTLTLFEKGLLEQAEASMEIAEISYRAGEISFMDYLDARRTYHSIQIQYQQALYEWNVERAALDRAAGGGTRP